MPAVACAPVRQSAPLREPKPISESVADSIVQPPGYARPQRTVRPIEGPVQHGEKPFVQLVEEAFDGPVLTLSKKLRLMEQATNRNIRRGIALDVIAATQHKLDRKFAVRRPTFKRRFTYHFAAFAALYVIIAIAWCVVISLS